MKKLFVLILVCTAVLMSACGNEKQPITVSEPERIATGDEIYSAKNENAVEESENVNGMRFTLTLEQFTEKYNEIARKTDGVLAFDGHKWKTKGDIKHDSNGVEYQYYYFDDSETNLTATVEKESGKLLNVGCGTTMSNFVAQDGSTNNSDAILKKAAVMATAVCQFPTESLDVIQDIFYRTTFENNNSLWYQGFIFSLSTQENSKDSEKSVMLLRVFPVKDEKKDDWQIPDYESQKI